MDGVIHTAEDSESIRSARASTTADTFQAHSPFPNGLSRAQSMAGLTEQIDDESQNKEDDNQPSSSIEELEPVISTKWESMSFQKFDQRTLEERALFKVYHLLSCRICSI